MLNDKKISYIPALFRDNKFVTDFGKKADVVNSVFVELWSIIENLL